MLIKAKRKRRPLVTQDGTTITHGESYPIAGEPVALDERPRPETYAVTFDGAAPPTTEKDHR